jgi:phosphorylase kinase alpha/beta subunit
MEKRDLNSQSILIVHQEDIRRRIKPRYTLDDISGLRAFLNLHGTLNFRPLSTGLYPAAGIGPVAAARSGYGNVWVRDNVYVALAHENAGQTDAARATIEALASFYIKYCNRFELIVEGRADPQLPMNRPQVRFDGLNLSENATSWSHAQNDALGYFLWMYCRLALNGHLVPNGQLLALLVLYFETIRYWEDEDSGHWEERRKVEASSIGPAVAGLQALRSLFCKGGLPACQFGNRIVGLDDIDRLIEAGSLALASILPAECIQAAPKYRRYDAALLFLVYPLDVVKTEIGLQIVKDVQENLQGDYGIRRYLGDSYWTADYKDKVAPENLTADVSEHQEERDALAKPGEEAQWCIFDPIISVIAGSRYLATGNASDLEQQVHYLNRSLGQITGPDCPQGEMRCPEAYYSVHGRYVPNDQAPLLWTQANLLLALLAMKKSAAR